MRTNHDYQYLFTQIHALAIIYYTMKYISKAEDNTHSKLTIAAVVAKALNSSSDSRLVGIQKPPLSVYIRPFPIVSLGYCSGSPSVLESLDHCMVNIQG